MIRKLAKSIFILIFFALALYIPFLGDKEFQGEEGRRVLIAIQMIENKEYLMPKLFGESYFNKPPLFNWVLAFVFHLTGDFSEFTARALSSLSILVSSIFLTLIWIEIIKKEEKGSPFSLTIALLPGLIFLTTPEVIDKALRAEIDAFYVMLLTLALFLWFYLYEIKLKKKWAFMVSGIFLGLGILTKTFQALIFFYLAFIPYLIIQRRGREIFTFAHILGILSCLVIFLAWAIPVSMEVGIRGFLESWLSEYKSAALAKEMSPLQHIESFTLSALFGYSPWIFFLIFYKNTAFHTFLKDHPLLKKLFLFSVFEFGFSYLFHFFFFGARLRYILPSVGGFVFLSATFLYYLFKSKPFPQGVQRGLTKVFSMLSLMIALAFLFMLHFKSLSPSPYFYLFHLSFVVLNLVIFLKEKLSSQNFFWYLVFYVFLTKELFVTFYYPLHEMEMNYFRKGAWEISRLMKESKTLYLCHTIPHHLVYYLKYKYKLLENIIYLNNCEVLPEKGYVLFYEKDSSLIKGKNFEVYPIKLRGKSYYLVYKKGT